MQNSLSAFISVIVPVFNVDQYLARCVESILKQTFTDYELLLVDDGSTDKSGILCDDFAKKDSRIKCFHKKNGGLSDARNYGIQHATGDYISLIDSDDYVSPYFLEHLYNNLVKSDADISVCEFTMGDEIHYFDYTDKKRPIVKVYSDKIEKMGTFFKGKEGLAIIAVNKLYKKTLFEGIEYPYGKLYEDEATTFKLFYKSNKAVFSDEVLYYYFQRPNSITNSDINPKKMEAFEALESVINFYEQADEPLLKRKAIIRYFKYLKTLESKVKININKQSTDELIGILKQIQVLYIQKLNLYQYNKLKFLFDIYGIGQYFRGTLR